jgi:hypothetical protein
MIKTISRESDHAHRVDHSTMNRWVIKYRPQLEAKFHRRKRPVWSRWQLVETDQTVKGQQMMGLKSCNAAQNTLTRNELMRMIRKGLMAAGAKGGRNSADPFYALAFYSFGYRGMMRLDEPRHRHKRRNRIHTNHMPRTARPIGKTTIGGRTS